ncbi:MAG: alpha/beta hydrolase [Phycisphaerales bacterium]
MTSGKTFLQRLRPPAIKAVIVFIVLTLLWWIGGGFLQRKMIFPRHMIPVTHIVQPDYVQPFTIDTDAGKVDAMFIPAPNASADHPAPLLVFAHGNAELIDFWPAALEPYRELGLSVLLVEYRGYGKSAGSPSQAAITADFLQAIDTIAKRPDIDAARIIYHGRSLGGGVVCSVLRSRPPAALILQSAFTSIPDMAIRLGFPGFLVFDKFDNASALASYTGPVLVMHGRLDNVIPFQQARQLAQRVPRATFVPFNCGHNDFPLDSTEYRQTIADFLRDANMLRHGG